ncbi:MAG: hypothetical protein JXL67_00715 [Calditrichaeota bacterium]|nr:hypothetical protein [Calditrichota bacterium]
MLYRKIVIFIFIMIAGFSSCGKKESDLQKISPDSARSQYPPEFQHLIGLEFGPDSFPSGFEEQAGYVFGFMEGNEYVIDHVTKNQTDLLWLCKLTGRDDEGRPFLKILDLLILPRQQENEMILMGSCKVGGEEDPEIVAVVEFIDNMMVSEVHHAWRADRKSERFKPFPVDSVECLDESYFL